MGRKQPCSQCPGGGGGVSRNNDRRIRFSPTGTTKQSLKRSGPLNVKTIEQSLKRNGPLDARGIEQILKRNGLLDVLGIEQILKRNGLLKDSDIAIVLNVHLARRKELRSLKGMSYLYNPPSHIKMDYLTCYTAHNRV